MARLTGIIAALAALAFVTAGVGTLLNFAPRPAAEEDGRIPVAATIYPLYDLVRSVGGERVNAVLLLPPGASPETFDLSPASVREVLRARLLFAIGHGVDDWAFRSAPGTETVLADRGISLRAGDEDHEDEEESEDVHGHEGADPHYWLAVSNVIRIADTIAVELARIDPAGEEAYRANASSLQQDLRNLEARLSDRTRNIRGRSIITMHDAWEYFAPMAGVNIVGTVVSSPGQELGPRSLAALGALAREYGVTAVFSEPQLSSSTLLAFAADNGLRILELDPIGGVPGRETYADLMEHNIEQLLAAFKE